MKRMLKKPWRKKNVHGEKTSNCPRLAFSAACLLKQTSELSFRFNRVYFYSLTTTLTIRSQRYQIGLKLFRCVCKHGKKCYLHARRVTGLGEFSPNGCLLTLCRGFLIAQVTNIFGLLFSTVSIMHLFWPKNVFGYILNVFSQTRLVTLHARKGPINRHLDNCKCVFVNCNRCAQI
jgi:hypothetical protein